MVKSVDWNHWRKWLEKNKIYFEVIVMVALTLMSVLVGISANNIADSQLRVEKINHQPVFEFESYTDSNESFKWLNVYNTGYPIESIEICEPIVLLQMNYNYGDQPDKIKYFILDGFYRNTIHPSLPGENQLFRFGNVWIDYTHDDFNTRYEKEDGNLFKYWKLSDEIGGSSLNNTLFVHSMGSSQLVHIKYTDMYGDEHESLYYTNSRSLYKIHENNFDHDYQSILDLKDSGYVIDLNNYSSEYINEKLMEEQTVPAFSFK